MSASAITLVRVGKSLAVHLVFAGLLYGLALYVMGNFDNASLTMREQYDSNEVLQLLGAARSKLIGWYMLALAFSWLLSSLFLAISQRRMAVVRGHAEARRSMPLWIVLFVLVIAVTGFVFWRQVSLTDVAQMLLDSKYLLLTTIGFVVPMIAYWLACGLAVTITLKPAVPMAESLLPEFWN
ncbi:MAG: hypothetical protein RL299_2078 [Pseudomonadota bacterium]|jgi:hypothetical protein